MSTSCRQRVDILPHNDNNNGWLRLLPALPAARVLRDRQRCDYAIVGAGYTGLAAARRLAELAPQAHIAIIDGGRIGNNAAGRCSGFAIDQAHSLRAANFAAGLESERQQLRLNRAGQAALREAVQANGIDCDWREVGKIHAAATDKGRRLLRHFTKTLDALGSAYEFRSAAQMRALTGSDFYREGLFTPGTIQMQPAALVRGLAQTLPDNVSVYEDSLVRSVDYAADATQEHQLHTAEGLLQARTLLLANNSFGVGFGFYRQHLIPLPTYASMTRALDPAELRALGGESDWGLIPAHPFGSTVRRIGDRILVRNIYAYAPGHNPTEAQRRWARSKHRRSFARRFPALAAVPFEYSWGGTLCLSQNSAPVFGELRPQVYASLCHNGVGIARGTICGALLAELILGRESELLKIMLTAARPSKAPPRGLLRLGAPLNLAMRRWQAGREL